MANFLASLLSSIARANDALNGIIWGLPTLALIMGVGVVMSFGTGFFQFRHMFHVLDSTIISALRRRAKAETVAGGKSISQLQAVSGALAATIGTGNIAGVATAIMMGGPGAILWMWVSAILGMMTIYSENVLGIYYRKKNDAGEWAGGPMYYIEEGLSEMRGFRRIARPLAMAFALCCTLASFGIGNMTQVNTISTTLQSSFAIPPAVSGVLLAIAAQFVLIGGISRIGAVAEKMVPFMAGGYVLLTVIILFSNYKEIPHIFSSIIGNAFGVNAITGGISGVMVKQAMTMGFKRGVFSNEAGMGSSVIISCASDVKEPAVQGMWGIFQVFVDTIVICSLTAFALLSTDVIGKIGPGGVPIQGAPLVAEAFSTVFGDAAGGLLAVAVLFFAFATVIGWSYFGEKSVEYLLGSRAVMPYKIIFVLFIVVGALLEMELVWDISDTLNGLMAIPNLIALLLMAKMVMKITDNYSRRKFGGEKSLKPMLSAYDSGQEQSKDV
ncbi:MAG: alanine/glycine:cation symporter family protein [Christensenellales bacterium]